MKKILLLFVGLLAFSSYSQAQGYSSSGGSSIGARFGFEQGVTYKKHLGGGAAFEGILSARNWFTNITGLYHFFHKPTGIGPGLDWFVGAGGHLWIYNVNNRYLPNYATGNLGIGVDGVLGMQYNFAEVPFNIALDWKPALNLIGGSGFYGGGFGLSVRYRWK